MKIKLPSTLESTTDCNQSEEDDDDVKQSTSLANEEAGANKHDDVNKIGLLSSLFYIIVIFAIGLPIWFKTTSPSRYTLPDVASLMVHSQTTTNTIEINVVVAVDLDKEALLLQLPRDHISSDGSMAFKIEWKVRKMIQKEEDIWSKAKSLDKFDDDLGQLESHRKPGKLYIFLVDMNLVRQFGRSVTILGSNRFVYIGVRDEEMSVIDESEDRSLVMIIMDILETVLEVKNDQLVTSLSTGQEMDEKENMKYLLNREVDIIINYIGENVEDSIKPETNELINKARKLGEESFVQNSGISNLFSINLVSEMVYYCFAPNFIENNLVNAGDANRKERLFNKASVALLLNSIESRIVEPNNKLNYHLHVIIPSSKANQSTFFYDQQTKDKSFAVSTSYRAGVFFWNKETDLNLAFKSFMRNLMGLSSIQPSNSLRRNIFFSQWELDYLMRRMTLQQLAKTLSSLESIDKLLIKVKNIVILQEIAQKMNLAADLSHQAIDLLAQGNLMKASELSSRAFDASESAFFDPSLLSRLYFPEDQKYAVYFPLFLPVSVPLALSCWHLIRIYFKKKTHEKKD